MGLRCLLGHEYANREVEREREERGNEVVVTYRTVETCDRCGERRIVSENKEVRPVRDPESPEVATGLGEGGVTPDLGEEADDASPQTDDTRQPRDDASPPADEGVPVETETDRPDPAVEGGDPATAAGEDAAEPPAAAGQDAAEPATAGDGASGDETGVDDAIILDEGPEADREHGEWPDDESESTAEPPEPAADAVEPDDGATVVSGDDEWPTPEGEDEGYDAEPDDGEPADVSFEGGLTPEGSEEAPAAAANGSASATGKQFVAAEIVDPVRETDPEAETEFFCPNCGYARTAGGSSMRAGDICPDCHQGYIGERPR